jgi:phosphatidylinositol glycan class S
MTIQQPLDKGAAAADLQNSAAVAAPAATTSNGLPLPARKEPPPEKPSDVRRRSYIILSFWLIVLCLGLPIWWKTTTIYRADLPLQEMLDWADGKVCARHALAPPAIQW